MKSRYQGEAIEEAVHAAQYYERREEGLGDRFLESLRSCVSQVEMNPRLYPKEQFGGVRGEIRSCTVEGFPFSVVYEILTDELLILAIQHHKRRSGYWKHRRV